MLEREGGDSPSPEDEIDGGLSIDEVERMKTTFWMSIACTPKLASCLVSFIKNLQVLARARERGDGEECGLEEEDSDRDSSEEEDIVTEFPISNGGNSSLAEVCLPSLLNYTEPIFRTCIELIK